MSSNIDNFITVYEAEDEEEFMDDFEEEICETEQLETSEIIEFENEPEEDFQLKFF